MSTHLATSMFKIQINLNKVNNGAQSLSTNLSNLLVLPIHGCTQVNGLFQGYGDPRQGMLGSEEVAGTTEINWR